MNTLFLSWEALEPRQLRAIAVSSTEVTLVYKNDSELALEFSDEDQLDRFLNGLVGTLIHSNPDEDIRRN